MKNQKNPKDAGEEGKNRVPFIAMVVLTLFAGGLFFSTLSSGQEAEVPAAREVEKSEKDKESASGEKKSKKAQTDNQTETVQEAVYIYDPSVLPDPFLPLVQETTARVRDITTVEIATPATPLQRYSLDEFKLVAVIISDESAALLEDPAGFGYTVRKGMEIGKHNGIIREISRQGITVEEKHEDSMGNIELRISNLTIRSTKR